MLSFLGRKKNNIISLQAIRRWESRTFLGKWWQQQEAVLFILTRRQISTCNQEDLTHTRTVYLSQQTLGLQFPLQSFLLGCWCLCCASTQQAVGKSNHHPFLCSYNPTSIVSLDSAVVTVNEGKKNPNTSINGLRSNVMRQTKEINTVTFLNPLNCLLRQRLKVSIQTAAADGWSISQRIQSISQHINL